MNYRGPKEADVKLVVVAGVLPVNTWFDKYEFSALTGIRAESCPRRLKTLVDNKLLMVRYIRGVKSKYKMTKNLKEKMLGFRAAKEKKKLNPENISRAINRLDIDKLLFSTKFV